ncbi:MAG: hypothetical protein LBP22_04595 [Deltaproteobacteria bacterium]|jgi:hypothetical protein|nr:hypothetical protein [Deltaproteobacteria bacterium]
MSNRRSYLMLIVLLGWLMVMGAVYLAMGRDRASDLQEEAAGPVKPGQPPPFRAPKPSPDAGLAGFGPCPAVNQGQGAFTSLTGRYDEKGRYVVYLGLTGSAVWPQIHEQTEPKAQTQTYADFRGQFTYEKDLFQENDLGPVNDLSLKNQAGLTRLTVNYHPTEAPAGVAVEFFCRTDTVALRYTFTLPVTAQEAAPPLTADQKAEPQPVSRPPAVSPPPLGSAAPVTVPAGPAPGGSAPMIAAGELAGYGPCPAGEGQGRILDLKGHYDPYNRYVLLMSLDGRAGDSAVKAQDVADRGVTYVDLAGRLPFEAGFLEISPQNGPGRHVRLGLHKGFTRISFNYRAGFKPAGTEAEILCRDGSLALRYTFQGFSGSEPPPADGLVPEEEGIVTPPPEPYLEVTERELGREAQEERDIRRAQAEGLAPLIGLEPSLPKTAAEEKKDQPLAPKQASEPAAPNSPAPTEEPARPESVSAGQGTGPETSGPTGPTDAGTRPGSGPDEILEPSLPAAPAAELSIQAPQTSPESAAGESLDFPLNPPKEPDGPDTLQGYSPAASAGEGSGELRFIEGRYEPDGRYILFLELTGNPGAYKAGTFGREQAATYLDLTGRYKFSEETYKVRLGPVRQFRFGRHQGFTRLSLTYERGLAPDEAEVSVLKNGPRLALIYTFKGGRTGEMAASIAAGEARRRNQSNVEISNKGLDGQGTLGKITGYYTPEGQYVLDLEFNGQLGEYLTNTDLTQTQAASYVDLYGNFKYTQDFLNISQGPVRQFRIGRHEGFVRLSLTYRQGQAPNKAGVFLTARNGRLIVRFAFEGGLTAAGAGQAAGSLETHQAGLSSEAAE